jgi:hypothetical protein
MTNVFPYHYPDRWDRLCPFKKIFYFLHLENLLHGTLSGIQRKTTSHDLIRRDGGRTKEGSQTGLDFQHTIGVPLPSYRNERGREVHIKLFLRGNNSDAV